MPARFAFNAELHFKEWGYLDSPEQSDPDPLVRGMARIHASRRVDDARQEYLATLTVRPKGARVFDFMLAHGFTYRDIGSPKTRHLTY